MTWSLTKLKTFESCGAKYDYKYNQKLQDLAGPAAQRGTEIHSTIEGFIKGEITQLTGPLEYYHGFLTALKNNPVPLYAEYEIKLTSKWEPFSPNINDIAPVLRPWYVGYLDLFRKAEVNAHVWDWKTGKIYDDHDQQKEIYALSVMSLHPEIEVVTATHVYVDLGHNRERVYTRASDLGKRKQWEERVKKMEETTEFIPNPTFMCRYCSYSNSNGGPCRF